MMNKTHGTKPMEQDVATDLEKLWHTTLADLAEQMVPTNFTRWLARTSLLGHEAGVAVVGVPDRASAEQLARRFDPLVRRALADACGEAVAVRYEVVDG
jgi:chromosomal replication initiation ATPase DnaA